MEKAWRFSAIARKALACHLAGQEAVKRQLLSPPHPTDHRDFSQDQMSQLPQSEGKNPYRRANSLAELLIWDDLDFVRCAYVTLLGRQPDLPGQAHYVAQIRAGYSKFDILWRVRNSSEAKRHDPGIAGLDRALKRAAWQRRPLLGAISRFLRADADGQSRNDRALRALMNATALNQRSLHAICERFDENPALTGWGVSPLAEPTSVLDHADQMLKSGTMRQEQGVKADQTPELDHLRTKAVTGRYIGDFTP